MERVVLHVGLGTFKKVDVEDIRQYDIHTEQVRIKKKIFEKIALAKKEGKRILAVGTTVLRTLESLPALWQVLPEEIKKDFDLHTRDFRDQKRWKGENIIWNLVNKGDELLWETKLFVYPGFEFQVVDSLITNFHLPKSSLLMLVAAFVGFEEMKRIYQEAIKQRYKFYSFGDGMWVV